MKQIVSLLVFSAAVVPSVHAGAGSEGNGARWSLDRAKAWYAGQPWLVGCNFIPSTAINQLEMWQADTFDPKTIDRELGWAADVGFNVVRVYLHDLAYEQDAEGFLSRIDQFLGIAARHNIRALLVFFDDCWLADPQPGKQPEPWPGVHNSGWLESPGTPKLKRYPTDTELRAQLERYVKAVVSRFREDERVLMWDLYNEPSGWSYSRGSKPGEYERAQTKELCLPLLRDAYTWARAANPTQPLTTCYFGIPEVQEIGLEWADILTFHHYSNAKGVEHMVKDLQEKGGGRPLICTEYMSRGSGSTFETHLPIFFKHDVGAINWGLVAGKTNTIYPWASWETPGKVPEPDLWFHDIFRKDGTPFDPSETEFIRAMTKPLDHTIELDTVLEHDEGDFLWFHPRVAAVPGHGKDGAPAVIMTIQKHLHKSDFYSGLSVMRTDDLGATWSGPTAIPELDWRKEGDEVLAVCDVTPGWHAQTGKLIAIGAKVRYRDGVQLYDKPDSRASGYAVWDPKTDSWTPWSIIELSDKNEQFYFTCPGCTQWIVEDDGTILVPLYCKGPGGGPTSVTVVRCAFDGTTLSYVEHGDILSQNQKRGVGEPQLRKFRRRYYLSIRHDDRGYVTVGDDGLHYAPMQAWTFDDGQELGSYNTQQHWVTHSEGLFLTYTRRGAENDHIMRHRAPLFIAQVNPATLQVIRASEKVLIPERGATLGNFGAAEISENESWVTVSEGVWSDDARKRGATGATFVARVLWNKPNALATK